MTRTPRSPSSKPAPPARAARPVDGLTTAERERPYTENPALLAREERFAAEVTRSAPALRSRSRRHVPPGPGWSAAVVGGKQPRPGAFLVSARAGAGGAAVQYGRIVLLRSRRSGEADRPQADRRDRPNGHRAAVGRRQWQGHAQAPPDLGPALFPVSDRRCPRAALRSHRGALSAHHPPPLAGSAFPGGTGSVARGRG